MKNEVEILSGRGRLTGYVAFGRVCLETTDASLLHGICFDPKDVHKVCKALHKLALECASEE